MVDYKFGMEQKASYTRQISNYCDLLRQMGYENVVDGLDDENKKELVSILRKYQSVFQVDGENLTTNNFYKQNVY